MYRWLIIISIVGCSIFAKPPALPNFGNSCYMNASVQVLYNVPDFTAYLVKVRDALNPTSFLFFYYQLIRVIQANGIQPELQTALGELYKYVDAYANYSTSMIFLHDNLFKKGAYLTETQLEKARSDLGSRKAQAINKQSYDLAQQFVDTVKPQALAYESIKEAFKEFINGYSIKNCQNDAGIIIATFIESVETEQFTPLLELIEVGIDKKTIGSHQEVLQEKHDPASIISLIIPEGHHEWSLMMLINEFLKPEILHEGRLAGYEQITHFGKAPKYLQYNIARLGPFAEYLQVPVLISEYLICEQTWFEHNEPLLHYELIGAIIHGGSAFGGHYTAYIKDQYETEQQWYYCDDARIRVVGKKLAEYDQQVINTQATFLMYKQLTQPVANIAPEAAPSLKALHQNLEAFIEALNRS